MYKMSNFPFAIEKTAEELKAAIAKKIHVPFHEISDFTITKKSVDARDKGDIHFVYALQFNVAPAYQGQLPKEVEKLPTAGQRIKPTYLAAPKPPIVVGMGPAGLFAAWALCKSGNPPVILERGRQVEQRRKDVDLFFEKGLLDTQSNVQFGEGGAGTFSDGKLTTGIKNPYCKKILEIFVECGGPEEILYLQKPHIGTDVLRKVVRNLREKLIQMGAQVHFEATLTGLTLKGEKVEGITWRNHQGEAMQSHTEHLFLAIGHSARDTYQMLYDNGLYMEQKPFAVGARIEHPQSLINLSQYGKKYAQNPYLGAAEYKLHCPTRDGRGVYTFCMCPGGEVVAATSVKGAVVTNGMSQHARSGQNANGALLVGIKPEDFESTHPLAGIAYQEKIEKLAFKAGGENYHAPVQRVEDFLKNQKSSRVGEVMASYKPGVTPGDLRDCLPGYVIQNMQQGLRQMDQKLKGFAFADALITGAETRSSSPVRIPRNEGYSANIKGLYPLGEGAGYAGGITSAAVDGMKVAYEIFTIKEK